MAEVAQPPAEFKHKRNGKRWMKKFMHLNKTPEALSLVDWSQFTTVKDTEFISADLQMVPDGDGGAYCWYAVAYRNRCAFDLASFLKFIDAELLEQATYYSHSTQFWDVLNIEQD